MKQFPKLNVDDRKLSQIQDNLSDAINPLLRLPLSDSNFLEDIDLVVGSNKINHGLGRELLGWLVVRRDTDDSIYDTQVSNPTPQLTLVLVSSGSVTVSMVVF